MNLQHHLRLSVNRNGVLARRDFLRGVSAASLAAGMLSWNDLVTVRADELRQQGMACILLFMEGGPSQFETFSPKVGHANGGETKAIDTSVAGIQIAENLPHLARGMQDLAVIRSMTTKEGSHPRAQFLMHTGYLPSSSVKYPTLGALVSNELPNVQCELPAFVRIGGRGRNNGGGGGLLGVNFDPFVMPNPKQLPSNTKILTDADRYQRRLGLLTKLESGYANSGGATNVAEHQQLYADAAKMITSAQMKAFDISAEPDSVRAAYGDSDFGAGCLMARRLVESGVTFVEVGLNGWDTHEDNFNRVRDLSAKLDQPFAQLINDLKQRGMLEKTLVIWTGEFGRTPKINPRGGRDHFPKAFNSVLAGGGIRGGQVIGSTDAGGQDVATQPINEKDLFQTVCKSLKINPAKENMSAIGRPIKIVDGGEPIPGLLA